MASRFVLVQVLLAAFGSPQAALADGTLRFAGRVTEASCALQTPAAGRAIVLAGCPLAARGSSLSIRHIEDAATARLVDPASGDALHRLALGAQSASTEQFSSRYTLDAPAHMDAGTRLYRISLDYL